MLLSDLRYRLRAIFGRDAIERELDDELRFHLDTEIERLVRGGLSLGEARRQARLAFGSVDDAKERSRDARGTAFLEHLRRDFSHAARLARKQPGFTAVVALSLAVGIGATAAAFNLTYDVLFAPLNVPHAEQLIALQRADRSDEKRRDDSFTWAEYRALAASPGVARLTTMRGASAVTVTAGERQEYINIHFVEGTLFPLIGARPLQGRLITPDDDARHANVVLLSQWFAERLFGGDSAVVGRTIAIRGAPFIVIGVMPRSFTGLEFPGWFTAAIPEGATQLLGANGPGRDNRGHAYGTTDARLSTERTFRVVGRLDAPTDAATSALGSSFERCCATNADARERLEVIDARRGIAGGKNDIRRGARVTLPLLLAGMLLVLVVVCCNIASLLLVRASARQREIAVRLSLGAARSRLLSQLVLESAPPALLGGAGAVLFAAWFTRLFIRTVPADRMPTGDIGTLLGFHGWLALGLAAALSVCCGIAFAVYPALRATKQDLAHALRLDARASRTRGQGTIARGVVVAQIAVTVVLVSAASLAATTLANLTRVDGGFATDRVLVAGIETRSTTYERDGVSPVREEIVRRVHEVPGVRDATLASLVPLFGGNSWSLNVSVPGHEASRDKLPSVALAATMPGYFDALGIKLASGRDFTPADSPTSERVAIVNASFARRYFADRNPIGTSFGVAFGKKNEPLTEVRIVGVAADAKYDNLRDAPEPLMYLPYPQVPTEWSSGVLVVRTATDPSSAIRAVRRAIDAGAPGIGVRNMRDMTGVRDGETTFERLAARLAAFVSTMALLLSAFGLYGVVAYGVSRRTSEIGIRLALGARDRAILWLVAKETIVLLGVGVAAGIPLSFLAGNAARSQLYGVSGHDLTAAALSVVVLAAASLVATIVPALRAVRIDPRIALVAD